MSYKLLYDVLGCGTEDYFLLKSFFLGMFSCLPCPYLTSFAHKDVHSMEVFWTVLARAFSYWTLFTSWPTKWFLGGRCHWYSL